MNIAEKLREMSDPLFKDFHSKLIPTVSRDSIIGVRVGEVRYLLSLIKNEPDFNIFLKELPHKYYEENNLHAFYINEIESFDECIKELELFLPYVDNWATCDGLRPVSFKKNHTELYEKIKEWIHSDRTYTVRFGIIMLLVYFSDEDFKDEHLSLVASVKKDDYYIKMAIAWYFQVIISKHYEKGLAYIRERRLSPWIHNKTIQKCIESNTIPPEKKAYLRELKIKIS